MDIARSYTVYQKGCDMSREHDLEKEQERIEREEYRALKLKKLRDKQRKRGGTPDEDRGERSSD